MPKLHDPVPLAHRRHSPSSHDDRLHDAADAELMRLVARGDQEAFALLYDRYAGLVYGVVRRVLVDPAMSEEVTQEILVEVWRTATRFDPDRGTARGWILTMAHRRAVDRVRSEQAHRDRHAKVAAREAHIAYDQVSEQVETSFEHRRVRQALDRLTDLQRESIEMAYWGGRTYREVAEELQVPTGTVKTRIRDGLIRLRDLLGVQ